MSYMTIVNIAAGPEWLLEYQEYSSLLEPLLLSLAQRLGMGVVSLIPDWDEAIYPSHAEWLSRAGSLYGLSDNDKIASQLSETGTHHPMWLAGSSLGTETSSATEITRWQYLDKIPYTSDNPALVEGIVLHSRLTFLAYWGADIDYGVETRPRAGANAGAGVGAGAGAGASLERGAWTTMGGNSGNNPGQLFPHETGSSPYSTPLTLEWFRWVAEQDRRNLIFIPVTARSLGNFYRTSDADKAGSTNKYQTKNNTRIPATLCIGTTAPTPLTTQPLFGEVSLGPSKLPVCWIPPSAARELFACSNASVPERAKQFDVLFLQRTMELGPILKAAAQLCDLDDTIRIGILGSTVPRHMGKLPDQVTLLFLTTAESRATAYQASSLIVDLHGDNCRGVSPRLLEAEWCGRDTAIICSGECCSSDYFGWSIPKRTKLVSNAREVLDLLLRQGIGRGEDSDQSGHNNLITTHGSMFPLSAQAPPTGTTHIAHPSCLSEKCSPQWELKREIGRRNLSPQFNSSVDRLFSFLQTDLPLLELPLEGSKKNSSLLHSTF